jgi:hypothetical protein
VLTLVLMLLMPMLMLVLILMLMLMLVLVLVLVLILLLLGLVLFPFSDPLSCPVSPAASVLALLGPESPLGSTAASSSYPHVRCSSCTSPRCRSRCL